jgi:hypothetical protein
VISIVGTRRHVVDENINLASESIIELDNTFSNENIIKEDHRLKIVLQNSNNLTEDDGNDDKMPETLNDAFLNESDLACGY